jgi:group I intron endonuclease
MKGIIYKITNKINNKSYIGQTTRTLKERLYCHKYRAFTEKKNHPLYCAMRKYGYENFYFKILEKTNDINIAEEWYIRKYKTNKIGYNIVKGGNNFKHNIYTKKKMSKIAIERFKNLENHPMYNKHHSKETKIKISKANKNMFTGINNPFYGKKHSEKILKKIAESKSKIVYKGKNWKVISPEGIIIIINNLKVFCKNNNLLYHSLKGVAHNTQKYHKGWMCEKI